MPSIPQYNEQQVGITPLPGVRVPQPLENPLFGLGRALERVGDKADRIVYGAEIAESAKLVGEGTEGLLGAIQEAKQKYENPEEYRAAAMDRIKEVYDSTLEKSSSARSRQRVEAQLANNLAGARRHVDLGYFEKKKDQGRADTDIALETLSRAAIADGSPDNMRVVARMAGDMLGRMKAEGYYTAQEVANLNQAFEKKVLIGSAQVQIRSNAESFLADVTDPQNTKYARLDLDTKLKLSEQARKVIEDQERQQDKVTKEVTDVAMRALQAAANRGAIDPGDMQDLLAGQNPYVTPQQARSLNEVNSNPPSAGAGGGTSVQALTAEYYLKPRSLAHINATRAKLSALQAQLGRPDPLINKLANELQSDQTTLENQGISREANQIQRENRGIRNLQNEYDAEKKDVPKVLQNLFGNHDAQNKAKIESEYRRHGAEAAKKLAENLAKGQVKKSEGIRQEHEKALNYGR